MSELVGATPAGWYPVQGGQRYWNGSAWTEHFAPAPQQAVVQRHPSKLVTYQPVRTSHGFHLAMTILTAGLWGVFVWLPVTLINGARRQRVVTRVR